MKILAYLLALVLAVVASAALATGRKDPKHDPAPTVVVQQKSNSTKHFIAGAAVTALVGFGAWYVFSDRDPCTTKDESQPQPRATPPVMQSPQEPPASAPAKPAPRPAIVTPKPRPRECEIPNARPKSVTAVGVEASPSTAAMLKVRHEF